MHARLAFEWLQVRARIERIAVCLTPRGRARRTLMSGLGLGCAKTSALAPHVEISLSNCISESQIILHTPGSMPCWRIVFSTFRGCMSFYTWGNSGIEPYSGSVNQLSRSRRGPPHGALQSWRTAMEHYVGLDVSLKLTAICIVDQTGKIEREGVVASDPETIAAFIKSHAPHVARVGLETGATSTWLWTELNKLGLPVICIDARHAKAALKLQINKSDRNDAVGIARIMQCG